LFVKETQRKRNVESHSVAEQSVS